MKRTATLLAATAVALIALPAVAQTEPEASAEAGLTWQDVTTPDIRFIQRDATGNVLFDSAGAPGATDPATAEAIERADGETTAETDEARPGWRASAAAEEAAGQGMTAESFARSQIAPRATEGTEDPDRGSAMAGDLSESEGTTSPTGQNFDLDEFAQELYREGYRQGYVSGLTQMRAAAARQMSGERERLRQEAAQQAPEGARMRAGREAATTSGRPQMQRQADGTTVIVLPAGMTPAQFVQSLSR